MNAIIGLCHFCEAHGPRPLFCTFTTDDESHTTEASRGTVQCSGCTSVGPDTVFVSRDDNGIIFCSRESVPNNDVTAFLRQAALRSITCEVSWSKEGGVVYFSDTQGHVLSLMFPVKDTRARGLKRLFSVVVLMKDKMLLLNITPVLSEHMQKIAHELQQLADLVYENEQSICSQRALRLKTGRNDFGQSRSLIQLTGDEDIFKKLHSHFTWMLRTGGVTYSETLYTSQDLLKKFSPTTSGTIFEENACTVPDDMNMSLRELERLLSKDVFRILLYCSLTGIDIVIKSHHTEPSRIINSLSSLIPSGVNHNISHIRAHSSVQVLPSQDVCILEETENSNFDCKWSHSLPVKCPTLMKKIENAMQNTKFNDAVLFQHIKSLQLEWLGITRTLKTALLSGKPDAVKNLEQVLGVTKQDESVVNYWSHAFCD
ncbi:folliculin [Maniola hyperantus]|uniref:folliculin n=1 Tax=Aphantopus hyperantus TaxID=2795564 RepID=UPI001569532D|nr:folliculin isoform X1 [Maniola hyperantus]